MNKIFIAILTIVALLIILFSFGIRKIALQKTARLISKADLNTKETFFNLASSYKSKGDYVKAREALSEFTKRFPDAAEAQNAEKEMEELNISILFSDRITEDSFRYEVKRGDALVKIASQFGTTVELVKKSNNLKTDVIVPGRNLKVNKTKFSILVDKSENTLTVQKENGEVVKTYRVSTGENLSTPTGTFKIEEKMVSPVWYKVGAVVEPGSPDYELGSRWMGLSVAGYGIHGTNDAGSIGKHITRGCVRMRNNDVEELYTIVPSGTEVTIVE